MRKTMAWRTRTQDNDKKKDNGEQADKEGKLCFTAEKQTKIWRWLWDVCHFKCLGISNIKGKKRYLKALTSVKI